MGKGLISSQYVGDLVHINLLQGRWAHGREVTVYGGRRQKKQQGQKRRKQTISVPFYLIQTAEIRMVPIWSVDWSSNNPPLTPTLYYKSLTHSRFKHLWKAWSSCLHEALEEHLDINHNTELIQCPPAHFILPSQSSALKVLKTNWMSSTKSFQDKHIYKFNILWILITSTKWTFIVVTSINETFNYAIYYVIIHFSKRTKSCIFLAQRSPMPPPLSPKHPTP